MPDINTEPSQNEQIIWDDPTAREERARLASNLQWPSYPTQYSELQVEIKKLDDSPSRKPVYHSEIAGQASCVTQAPGQHPGSEEPEAPAAERNLIPEPQAPSVAFPLAKPPVAPQPEDKVCWPLLWRWQLGYGSYAGGGLFAASHLPLLNIGCL